MAKNYDAIIIGAGSVGLPAAMSLGALGVKTAVIDKMPSAGQGGYMFPVYREKEENLLKGFLPIQRKYGLEIDYISPDAVSEIAPGINRDGLLGGTFSPNDGSASPMNSANAFFRKAKETGKVDFYFKEGVKGIKATHASNNGSNGGSNNFVVETDKDTYNTPILIDAAGPFSRQLGEMVTVDGKPANLDIPVFPDSHEGGVTEPVEPFFKTMLVDLRPVQGSKNYYFYQNAHGHIIFCITPDPPILGFDKRETSLFLPQVAARMLNLMPRLKNIRVRRVWRGLYPMTPDGSPIVSWNKDVKGLLHATGMCGQGYMLGPGIGEIISRMVTDQLTESDKIVTDEFSFYRSFGGEEALK